MASPTATAFILVIAAGLCTAIGSSAVFFPKLANLANRKTLAGSLGLAAGVMLYVGLVDIYSKAIGGFAEVHDEGKAFIYATLSFFGGCFLMLVSFVYFNDSLILIYFALVFELGSKTNSRREGCRRSITGHSNARRTKCAKG